MQRFYGSRARNYSSKDTGVHVAEIEEKGNTAKREEIFHQGKETKDNTGEALTKVVDLNKTLRTTDTDSSKIDSSKINSSKINSSKVDLARNNTMKNELDNENVDKYQVKEEDKKSEEDRTNDEEHTVKAEEYTIKDEEHTVKAEEHTGKAEEYTLKAEVSKAKVDELKVKAEEIEVKTEKQQDRETEKKLIYDIRDELEYEEYKPTIATGRIEKRYPVAHKMIRNPINYAKVRILNAAGDCDKINVAIGDRTFVSNLSYGKVSAYERVIDGYKNLVVYINRSPQEPLLITNLPFIAGTSMTLAVVDTARGLQLVPILDTVCSSHIYERACFRVANLTYDDGPFDILLNDNTLIFSDINVKEVTTFKQAVTGDYDFNVVIGNNNVLNFYVKIVPEMKYTACIIGGYFFNRPLKVIIIEN